MNQGRAFGAQFESGYCPQAHNSSTGNPQALSKMTSVPGEKQKAKAEPFRACKVFFLVKVKMMEDRVASLGNRVQSYSDSFIQIGFRTGGWQETHFTCARIGR